MYLRLAFLIFIFRDYKKCDKAKFRDVLNNFALEQFDVSNFKETIFHRFDEPAPIKQKYLPANDKGSRLYTNFLRSKSQKDRLKYNKQRNFVRNS